MPPTTLQRVLATNVVLEIIVDNLLESYHIACLCLVNREFYACFTQFLYRDITLTYDSTRTHAKEALLDHRHLALVRKLRFHVWSPSGVDDTFRRLIERMPALAALEWSGADMSKETIKSLAETHPNLSSLVVVPIQEMSWDEEERSKARLKTYGSSHSLNGDYAEGFRSRLSHMDYGPGDSMTSEVDRGLHVLHFANLRELTLTNMDASMVTHRGDLVQCLKRASRLTSLALAVGEETVMAMFNDDLRSVYTHYFRNLCEEYAQAGGTPLQLSHLSLGLAVLLLRDTDSSKKGSTNTASYLSKLAAVSQLQEVHIDNRGNFYRRKLVRSRPSEYYCKLAWWTFSPTRAPKLRRLTPTVWGDDLYHFLAEEFPTIASRRLALSVGTSWMSFLGRDYFNSLYSLLSDQGPDPPLRFRQVSIDLSDLSWDMAQAAQDVEFDLQKSQRESSGESSEHFAAAAADHFSTLEGLQVKFSSVLIFHVFLDLVLPRLRCLESLQMHIDWFDSELEASRMVAEFPATDPNSLPRRVAGSLPQLRFLRFRQRFLRSRESTWEVLRDIDGNVTKLVPMGDVAARKIECFRTPTTADIAWPGPEK